MVAPLYRVSRQQAEQDEDRDGGEDPQARRQSVEWSSRRIDVELYRIAGYHGFPPAWFVDIDLSVMTS